MLMLVPSQRQVRCFVAARVVETRLASGQLQWVRLCRDRLLA
jgi:hypothetical protein